jgi:hypothetical protein
VTVYTILDIEGNIIESWEEPATPYGGCCVAAAVDPCLAPPALVLAGSEDINVGDFFTASGGVESYVFSFPEGTISDEGEILTIDACASSGDSRAGTVTATDACKQTDSIEGRLTGGKWQGVPGYVPVTITGTVTRLNDYCIFSPTPLIVGGFQVFGRVSVWTWNPATGNVAPSSSPVSAGSVCSSAQTAYDAIDQTDDFKAAIDWRTLSVNEWQCP